MYKRMYLILLDSLTNAIALLQQGLQAAEEIYIATDDKPPLSIGPSETGEE